MGWAVDDHFYAAEKIEEEKFFARKNAELLQALSRQDADEFRYKDAVRNLQKDLGSR